MTEEIARLVDEIKSLIARAINEGRLPRALQPPESFLAVAREITKLAPPSEGLRSAIRHVVEGGGHAQPAAAAALDLLYPGDLYHWVETGQGSWPSAEESWADGWRADGWAPACVLCGARSVQDAGPPYGPACRFVCGECGGDGERFCPSALQRKWIDEVGVLDAVRFLQRLWAEVAFDVPAWRFEDLGRDRLYDERRRWSATVRESALQRFLETF